MKPIKIAQIGVGHDHAPNCCSCLKKNSDIFDFIGVASPVEEYNWRVRGEKANKSYEGIKLYTVDELLAMDDLEAVAIEAGKEYGVEYAQMFADKGIAVFIDKPGSADLPRWEKFIDTMKAKKLPMQLGYMYRFNPVISKAVEMAASGELGEIFSVEAQMSVRHDNAKREWLGRYKGGTMFFLGCHLVDLICQLQGFPKEVISYCTSTGNEGIMSDDLGFAVFKYDNGVSFAKACSSEVNGYDRRQLVISGTKGTIELRPLEVPCKGADLTTYGKYTTLDPARSWEDASVPFETEIFDRYERMMRYFAMTVRGETPMFRTYDYEKTLLKYVLMACGADDSVMNPKVK